MPNLSSEEILALIDNLLEVLDAPDEDGTVFECDDALYDAVPSWCGTDGVQETLEVPAWVMGGDGAKVVPVSSLASLLLLGLVPSLAIVAALWWTLFYVLVPAIGLLAWLMVTSV